MLEKADKLGRHGVSTGTIKSFFNAHTDDQYQAAMKQLDGNIIFNILKLHKLCIDSQGRNNLFLKIIWIFSKLNSS